MNNKKYFLPIILTIIIIVIMIYLFSTLEQPFVSCSNVYTYDGDVKVEEDITAKFNSNKIKSLDVVKTIIVPDEYANEEYIRSLRYSLEKSLSYLNDVKYTSLDDRLIVTIKARGNETVILRNIEFINSDSLQIKVNSNTKSSEVITVSVSDNYTEGEFMTRFKNNGYICK